MTSSKQQAPFFTALQSLQSRVDSMEERGESGGVFPVDDMHPVLAQARVTVERQADAVDPRDAAIVTLTTMALHQFEATGQAPVFPLEVPIALSKIALEGFPSIIPVTENTTQSSFEA